MGRSARCNSHVIIRRRSAAQERPHRRNRSNESDDLFFWTHLKRGFARQLRGSRGNNKHDDHQHYRGQHDWNNFPLVRCIWHRRHWGGRILEQQRNEHGRYRLWWRRWLIDGYSSGWLTSLDRLSLIPLNRFVCSEWAGPVRTGPNFHGERSGCFSPVTRE